MIYHRPAQHRGTTSFGWLKSQHTFSFGHYYDPKNMGFSALRVINDDTVAPGAGFGEHGHRDMEIISYVTKGAIEHRDSMGNQFVVPAGDIQRMSAGTGVMHSEFNHSKSEALKFLQIWIIPDKLGIKPSYEQRAIEQTSQLTPLVTPNGDNGSLSIQQNASIYRLQLKADETFKLNAKSRPGFLQVISGKAEYVSPDSSPSLLLSEGDSAGFYEELVSLRSLNKDFTALWFDLPAPKSNR